MRILFLDDDKQRHASYRLISIGDEVDHAWSAEEAIRMLDSGERYDYATLDHDLDEYAQMGQTPRDPTGQAVALHIASMPLEKRPKRVNVHSFNPVGAKRMVETLHEAGVRVSRQIFRGAST